MHPKDPQAKLWGGRFTASTEELTEAFTASVDFDRRLARYDIAGSKAHATMLAEVGVLSQSERDAILKGLDALQDEITAGHFSWSPALEDVHMNIEAALTQRIGMAGKKLHTGRSRNDQIATDMRLYVRDEIDAMVANLARLQEVLVDIAEREAATVMPGLTHLQTAQPVTFGHHMLAWFEMLDRDRERLLDCRRRVNRMPLGAGALAGTSFPINRGRTAELLGFAGVCENSLDAVSDRDFVSKQCPQPRPLWCTCLGCRRSWCCGHRPSLILSNLRMPTAQGRPLCRRKRIQMCPSWCVVSVVG
jgi:argininosuccinate lyase